MREITNWTASQPAERQELYKMKTGRHSSKKWMGSGQVTFFKGKAGVHQAGDL